MDGGAISSARADDHRADDHTDLLRLDPEQLRVAFDRRHFAVRHGLVGHALFTIPRLVRLAAETAASRPRDVYFDAGDIEIGQRWDQAPKSPFPVDETIRRIEQAGAWIILKNAQADPAYAEILEAAMADLLTAVGGGIENRIKSREVIVFITSPHRKTAYHIDTECNFLLQLAGRKQISLFDREDRDVLPEQEIERFWAADANAAVYKPALQHRATLYDLEPGNGVHIPVNCPHWVQNGGDVSVSVSINFRYHDRVRADLYRANHFMRKLGLRPSPPFRSAGSDWLKRRFLAAARVVRPSIPYS